MTSDEMVMITPHYLTTQTSLLLDHMISTFNAKLAMLWIAGTDSFYTISQKGSDNLINTKSLVSFLAGYYYRFMRVGDKRTPLILEDVYKTPNIPENLIKLAEIENITSLLISPVFHNKYVRGTLILGSDNGNAFNNIDYELLKLLSSIAFDLNSHEKNNNSSPSDLLDQTTDSFGLIIGRSKQLREIFKTILKISQSDANVLIYGESGTGKELIARTLHSKSKRKDQAFIPIDCVALPETLLESELFGYEKGAFTGADNIKRGLIEYADKGTFFLDEITELNIDLQAKLLRVLQERQFRRLGGKKLIDIDIRIISATNRDPKVAISKKMLREDLFYRLNVIPIYISPLRERREDIPVLIEHFMREFSISKEWRQHEISEEALQILINYKWPGNVRELQNLIERITALAKNEIIRIEDLPEEIVNNTSPLKILESTYQQTLPYNKAKEQSLLTFERLYFSRLMDKNHGNISRVAREAKVSRKTIYNILQKHGLNNYKMLGKPVFWHNK